MDIEIVVNDENFNALNWEALEVLEGFETGSFRFKELRHLLAPFVANGKGKVLPNEQAYDLLGKLNLAQIQEVTAAFGEAVRQYAVPKTTDSPLSPLSDTADEAPAG